MHFRGELDREVIRWEMDEERAKIALRSQIRKARTSSAEYVSLRSRVSRLLMKTAIAIDPDEGWTHFRAQIYRAPSRSLDG